MPAWDPVRWGERPRTNLAGVVGKPEGGATVASVDVSILRVPSAADQAAGLRVTFVLEGNDDSVPVTVDAVYVRLGRPSRTSRSRPVPIPSRPVCGTSWWPPSRTA